MSLTYEYHRYAVVVTLDYRVVIAYAAARLYDRGDTGFCSRLNTVVKREESIRRKYCACGIVACAYSVLDRLLSRPDTVRLTCTNAYRHEVFCYYYRIGLRVLDYFIRELHLSLLLFRRRFVRNHLDFVGVQRSVLILDEQSAGYLLHITHVLTVRLLYIAYFKQTKVLLCGKYALCLFAERRRNHYFKEDLDHLFSRCLVHFSVTCNYAAEYRYRIARVRLFICLGYAVSESRTARICMLDSYDCRTIGELFEQVERTAAVVDVVVRQLFTLYHAPFW